MIAITMEVERSMTIGTSVSVATPWPRSRHANRFERAFSSRYVRRSPSQTTATASPSAATWASNISWTHRPSRVEVEAGDGFCAGSGNDDFNPDGPPTKSDVRAETPVVA